MSRFNRQNLKKTPKLALRVSEHAMLRFRERVEEEFLYRSDEDLGDLLNERIRVAILSREVVDPRAPGTPTMLHLFESRTGMQLVAVVRDKCVVTVLDDWMARNNYPGWDGPATPPLSSSLGQKLQATRIEVEETLRPLVPLVIVPPSAESLVEGQGKESTAPAAPISPSDPYDVLTAECRTLGQRLRSLRERRGEIDAEIEAVLKEYEEKRGQLVAIMDEGASS